MLDGISGLVCFPGALRVRVVLGIYDMLVVSTCIQLPIDLLQYYTVHASGITHPKTESREVTRFSSRRDDNRNEIERIWFS